MISEERLRAAAREAGAALDHAPLPEEDHVFSEKYRRAVRQMEGRSRHPAWAAGLRRVAVILVVLLLPFGGWMTVDAQAREVVFGWVSETLLHHQLFRNDGQSEPTDTRYYLTEIPEGYSLWQAEDAPDAHIDYYVDKDGNGFRFRYYSGNAINVFLQTEGATPENVFVDGRHAEFYYDDMGGFHTLAWHDEEGRVLFLLTGRFDKETLIHYAETVSVEEK